MIGRGLYDPGANASAITLKALKKLEKFSFIPMKSTYNTTSGKGSILGVTILNVTILDITKRILLYVVDSDTFHFDFIIALDTIPLFKLALNEKLLISQNINVSPTTDTATISHVKVPDTTLINNVKEIWNDYMSLDLFNDKVKHLDKKKRCTIRTMVEKNSHAFAKSKFDVGNVTKYECAINLSKDTYVAKKPYRCSFQDQEEIEKQCKELLRNGMITQSSSPFASPVTMQFKKEGLCATKVKTRMCVDYRDLNRIIIPESQPFPLIDEILVKARGCSYFSAFDINAAFHSIPVRESDRHKLAFITLTQHYEWRVLPFGVKVASAIFQRVLSGILLRNNLNSFAVNYLDDILIFSRSFEEHLSHVQRVIDVIFEEGFRLNFKKCNFAMSSIPYLGHVLGPNTVQPLLDNLIAIQAFPIPSSRKNIRQFLGKVNFYRKFIPNSASLLEPFHNLLRKNVPFRWSNDCQDSFDRAKRLLTSSPILAIFDRTRPIFIYTDASGVGIGAVLKQTQEDGTKKPVAYFSRKLSNAQKKKKAIYIESLAVREAIRYWRFWLIGRHFTVITDHKPLEHLNLKARTDEELGDLANELLQFDFDILYEPGPLNYEADCLSRNPVLEPSDDSPPILPSFNFLSLSEIRSFQSNVRKLSNDFLNRGIIFRNQRGRSRIVLDQHAGERLIELVHTRFRHVGSKHVIAIVSKHFTFPNLYKYANNYCSRCTICIENKSRRIRPCARLGILGPASAPYEIMSLDTIGGLGAGKSPLRYLHLLVDHFSRFAYILCTKGQTAKEMISLIDSVHKLNPIGTLITDQYGGLSSDDFRSYCSRSSVRHVFVAVDSASSNGLNERLNQTIVNLIRCAKNDPSTPSRKSWAALAAECVEQYNSTPHSVTKFPPSYLLTGRRSDIVPDSLLEPPNLAQDRQIALRNSIRYHDYNKKLYDSNKSPIELDVGDSVFIDNGSKLNRNKLDKLRIGPYKIVKRLSNNVFTVNVGRGPQCHRIYHANKIILYKKCIR